MPKGKRTEKEYEEEIEKTAKRMAKKKEGLRSARDSEDWFDFLDNWGIDMSSDTRVDFMEKVRDKIVTDYRPKPVVPPTAEEKSYYRSRGIEAETGKVYRDIKTGRFTSEAKDTEPVVIYRHIKTGRFVSPLFL